MSFAARGGPGARRRGLQRQRRLPCPRRGHVPELPGPRRRAPLDARPRGDPPGGAGGPAAGRPGRRRAARGPRAVPGLQGLRRRVPRPRRHGAPEGGGAGPSPPRAGRSAGRRAWPGTRTSSWPWARARPASRGSPPRSRGGSPGSRSRPGARLAARRPAVARAAAGGGPRIALMADTFTRFLEPAVGDAAVRVLEAGGARVDVVDPGCCGRPLLSQGLVDAARRRARRALDRLAPHALAGTRSWCSSRRAGRCSWTTSRASCRATRGRSGWRARPSASSGRCGSSGCRACDPPADEAVVHEHCHARALGGGREGAAALLALAGPGARDSGAGCCGMAGSFGYRHPELSRRIAEDRLAPAARGADVAVAAGTSCRAQIRRVAGAPRAASGRVPGRAPAVIAPRRGRGIPARALNGLVTLLVGRMGLPVPRLRLLRVHGRRTGRLRSTPVLVLRQGGRRYLVAPRGETGWVRNLRAAGWGSSSAGAPSSGCARRRSRARSAPRGELLRPPLRLAEPSLLRPAARVPPGGRPPRRPPPPHLPPDRDAARCGGPRAPGAGVGRRRALGLRHRPARAARPTSPPPGRSSGAPSTGRPRGSLTRADIDYVLRLGRSQLRAGQPDGRRRTVARTLRVNAWWYAYHAAPADRVIAARPGRRPVNLLGGPRLRGQPGRHRRAGGRG